jgi:hypothetical protein
MTGNPSVYQRNSQQNYLGDIYIGKVFVGERYLEYLLSVSSRYYLIRDGGHASNGPA